MLKRTVVTFAVAMLLTACASTGGGHAPTDKKQFAEIKTQISVEYMRLNMPRRAIESIEEAVTADPYNAKAWLVRAEIYQRLKVNEKAEQSYQRALSLSPTNAEINNDYGWFLCDSLSRWDDSVKHFNRTLEDPTYPTPELPNLNLGICSARAGRYQDAIRYLERAATLSPRLATVTKEMARVHYLQARFEDADQLFRRYQRSIDGLEADDLLLGWRIANAMGQARAAREYKLQLERNYPSSPEWMNFPEKSTKAI